MDKIKKQVNAFLENDTAKTWQYHRLFKTPLGDLILSVLPTTMHNYSNQRKVWHINNGLQIARCYCDNDVVWVENKGLYSKYCSQQCQRKNSEIRKNTWAKKLKEEWRQIIKKRQETSLLRYGVDNPSKSEKIKQQLRTKTDVTEQDRYYREVRNHTEYNWRYHKNKIPNGNSRNIINHLDHIYSIKNGYDNNIPPEIIGHWTNLQVIENKRNNKKGQTNGKTKNKLYEDYNENINR